MNAPPPELHAYPWGDVIAILALIALNGLFAMSELAIVSARKPRLRAMERAGKHGAASALRLGEEPGRFLSTVQIGITLIGIVAGAYSGSSLGGPTAERLRWLGLGGETAETIGYALVIGLTTYASLIIGELVPKQFALRGPEPIACILAPIMTLLARVTAPLVWFLDQSSMLIFRLLGMDRESQTQVTAEELHLVVAEAHTAGVIEESERAMISSVVRLADRTVRGVMTPRGEVDWLDRDADAVAIGLFLNETPHSRIPVADGSVDEIVGVVQSRDLLAALLAGGPLDLAALLKRAPVISDRQDATDALAALQGAEVPVAFVHDEYGHFEGLVTPADLLAAIAGGFVSDAEEGEDPPLVEREDGSWLVSGSLSADAMADRLGLHLPPERDYETVAGFALASFRHLPETGEYFRFGDWRFEVVDMDGRKIDKLLASCIEDPDGPAD